jgi:hypothetical protein
MPYDPNFPPDHQPLNAAPFRDQFNGLKDAVDLCVTTADMETEMFANTAGNVSAIAKLNLTVSNPPTPAQVQAVADKVDELITLLQRP